MTCLGSPRKSVAISREENPELLTPRLMRNNEASPPFLLPLDMIVVSEIQPDDLPAGSSGAVREKSFPV